MTQSWPVVPGVRGVFVTGTDTDVGKTVIAAGLTAALRSRQVRAVYFKPVQSGCREEDGQLIATDARFAQTLAGLGEPLSRLTPITLKLPLAPAVAAAQAGVTIDLEVIAAAYRELAGRYDFLVVEGAGGLYVPLIDYDFLVLDLARWLRLPLVIVARPGLGTINHTVMTVKAALHAGLSVAGVIINQYPEHPNLAGRTNPEIIEALSGRPILGKIPLISDLQSEAGKTVLIESLADVLAAPTWRRFGGPVIRK
ncbi:dethiobiotin synthase [Desulfobacca acetoxidans]|uniref:ATP-dependent dethiobiotin synthetase BioD n=1 Tax=Desulfobacca acetoxidans (strain ATCC 700848 / DSM 11109 / ASRB2) TaxID=880072 RepID=F2NFZ6_DESAR|nr:dethiobiotin synthase [Desulfobacca acetoxidans]AEB08409.1 Dethiobiotin synthetase [Desulfobacca acetoxidans DSM 11109]